ncbi:hypothetical protein QO002_000774 [Pararhizobium capsulatum DSM 1112]|uniref:Uncharacterized protein n=1 Tax=Pararhizobium capsulatum DSM 1112 TaxID=1121113 RepID=A0ABU0BLR1_9HYPH|nr:hypothetical protein [Pararhizobium capsulatum]MDQ0318636.1 hypothetical protein [Pararhizobium capsulatum DSM 1112]
MAELYAADKSGNRGLEPNQRLDRVIYPFEVVPSWEIDVEGMSIILQIEELHKRSTNRGETLTTGRNYGFTSCEAYIISVLRVIRPDLFSDVDPCLLQLQELTPKVLEKAERMYLVKPDSSKRIYDFGDTDTRHKHFDDVTADPMPAIERVARACADPDLSKKVVPGMPSWRNMHNNFKALHPSPDARLLYFLAARDATHKIEQLAGTDLGTPPTPNWPVDIEEFEVDLEATVDALSIHDLEQARGIEITALPQLADTLLAYLATGLKEIADVGVMLTFDWGDVRAFNLNPDGVTAPLEIDVAAAAAFALGQPIMERLTEGFCSKLTGWLQAVETADPLAQRLKQRIPVALFGGGIIGAFFGTITALNHDEFLGTKLGYELASVAPALLIFMAAKIAYEVALFRQKYQMVKSTDPAYLHAKKTLKKILGDFVDLRHWMVNRLPKFAALATFPQVYCRWVFFCEKTFGKDQAAQLKFAVGFTYFFTSITILISLMENGHKFTQDHIDGLLNSDIGRRIVPRALRQNNHQD